ncbi:hypothetical protein BDQ17DRAFT_1362187 [Cyathus striatus]|nr:hypothetical protein BDQ17DRAFT_1362187 [Cyathus striatus]
MRFLVVLSAVCVATALNIRDTDSASASASISVSASDSAASDTPTVVTAEKVFHTVINVAPFLTDSTTTFIWTQTPTEVASSTSA